MKSFKYISLCLSLFFATNAAANEWHADEWATHQLVLVNQMEDCLDALTKYNDRALHICDQAFNERFATLSDGYRTALNPHSPTITIGEFIIADFSDYIVGFAAINALQRTPNIFVEIDKAVERFIKIWST